MKARSGAVVGLAVALLASCVPTVNPLAVFDQLPEALVSAINEQGVPVSSVTLRADQVSLSTNRDGELVVQQVVPAGEPQDSGGGLVGMSAATFPTGAVVERAEQFASGCTGDWEVVVQAVSPSAVQTSENCQGESGVSLNGIGSNGIELSVLAPTWDVATLTRLWQEIEVAAPGKRVRQVALDPQTARLTVELPLDAQSSPSCGPAWIRQLDEPADSRPTCLGDGTPSGLKLVDLNTLSPERLVTLVNRALGQLPGAEASKAFLLIDGYQLSVSVGSQQAHVPLGG